MDANVVVDNKLESGQAHSIIRQGRHGEGVVRVSHIHHHIRARPLSLSDFPAIYGKFDRALINISMGAFSARDSYINASLQELAAVAGADDTGKA
jgi:hypothetical protein